MFKGIILAAATLLAITSAQAGTVIKLSPNAYDAASFNAAATVRDPANRALLFIGFGVIGIAARRKAAPPAAIAA